jgi:DNA-binding transcriptional regulator LsrR (DeoR family)
MSEKTLSIEMAKLRQARYSIGIAMGKRNTLAFLAHCTDAILIVW